MPFVRALLASSHPGPSAVVTVLALLLGVAVGLPLDRLALLTAAVLCGQLSVGISNDAGDHARDRAVGRTDKPLARGDVPIAAAWTVAAVLFAAALVLSALLGVGMLIAHGVALVSAWAYNALLKSTLFSVAPFVVSFGIFPSLATLSAEPPALAAPWAWVAGAALGVAVHLTNVLPDLDDDRRTGIRGLVHRMGPRPATVLAAASTLAGAVAVVVGTGAAVLPVVLAVVVAALAVATVARTVRRGPDRVVFRLVMGSALLLAVSLVAAPGALTA